MWAQVDRTQLQQWLGALLGQVGRAGVSNRVCICIILGPRTNYISDPDLT